MNVTDVSNSTLFNQLYPSKISQISQNYMSAPSLVQTYAKNSFVSEKARKSFGLSYDNFFISCHFALVDCSSEDWLWYFDVKYGNCFKFNSGRFENGSANELKTATQTGILGGIIVEIFVASMDNQNALSNQKGVHIFIGNNTVVLDPLAGIKASVGTSNFIGLQKSVHQQLSKPYSNCIEDVNSPNGYDSKYFRQLIALNYSYTQEACFNM
jgi:hypothetical protein